MIYRRLNAISNYYITTSIFTVYIWQDFICHYGCFENELIDFEITIV